MAASDEVPAPDALGKVVVSDVRMPFWSMVVFMVKWAIASIPAFLILALLTGAVIATMAGVIMSAVGFGSHLLDRKEPVVSTSPVASAPAEREPAPPAPSVDLSVVQVHNLEVGESVLGEPGVFGEIKNTGDRVLTKVEITIYCLNTQGEPIFDKTYCPVLVTDMSYGDAAEPLKPNYSRKFGVRLDDAPSDWAKKVRVKVTSVEVERAAGP